MARCVLAPAPWTISRSFFLLLTRKPCTKKPRNSPEPQQSPGKIGYIPAADLPIPCGFDQLVPVQSSIGKGETSSVRQGGARRLDDCLLWFGVSNPNIMPRVLCSHRLSIPSDCRIYESENKQSTFFLSFWKTALFGTFCLSEQWVVSETGLKQPRFPFLHPFTQELHNERSGRGRNSADCDSESGAARIFKNGLGMSRGIGDEIFGARKSFKKKIFIKKKQFTLPRRHRGLFGESRGGDDEAFSQGIWSLAQQMVRAAQDVFSGNRQKAFHVHPPSRHFQKISDSSLEVGLVGAACI